MATSRPHFEGRSRIPPHCCISLISSYGKHLVEVEVEVEVEVLPFIKYKVYIL